ncbi:protein-tyrosine phosphatase-like protein [Globomyces pollinis-pini]|nr:protein-tyrosine phosphatase-like protein [Globomyces pollinis-pini]
MEQISNFRDAGLSNMKRGLVYRSATLDKASSNDIDKIINKLGVKTIIDLRGGGESLQAQGDESIYDYYTLKSLDSDSKSDSSRRLYRINLAKSLRSAMWNSISWWTKLLFIFYRLIGQKLYAYKVLMSNSFLGKEGLWGLNRGFIDYGTADIKRFLDIMSKPETYPVIIHCSAGKDRTGLTISLLQAISKVRRPLIVKDYSMSQELLKDDRARLIKEVGKLGLGEEFAKSEPEIMETILNYLDSEYGSLESYLASIGVDSTQQQQLANLLLENSKL